MNEVAKATDVACVAGADFVKTSTGFFSGSNNKGATPEVVKVMLDAARGRCKIKGAGGIRDQEHFFTLIDMGIDRMGVGYRSTPVVLGVKKEDARKPASFWRKKASGSVAEGHDSGGKGY
jgi:deoxyribose-phosphate aldolase